MQASGIAARRVFVPFAVLGLLFALVSFTMNDYFLPLGSIQYGKLYRSLIVSSPAVELKPWSSRRYKDITIVTGDVQGSMVKDILIFDKAENGKDRVISAKTARLSDGGSDSIVLDLGDVWMQTLSVSSDESGRVFLLRKDGIQDRYERRTHLLDLRGPLRNVVVRSF